MICSRITPAALFVGLLAAPAASAPEPPTCKFDLVRSFPHDSTAFTQGLVYDRGFLFESTGLVGSSTIRKVRIADGRVLQRAIVAKPHFGEGMTKWKNELLSLTWQSGKGFRWDSRTLRRKSEFSYAGEGWGLTHDGRQLILSDGTPFLRFLDPATMKLDHRIVVTYGGRPLRNLNELEWVNGEIFANVWMTDQIVRIDPVSGKVRSLIDIADLRRRAGVSRPDAVANGIAYDAKGDRLFVTGKNWPKLFQIKLPAC